VCVHIVSAGIVRVDSVTKSYLLWELLCLCLLVLRDCKNRSVLSLIETVAVGIQLCKIFVNNRLSVMLLIGEKFCIRRKKWSTSKQFSLIDNSAVCQFTSLFL